MNKTLKGRIREMIDQSLPIGCPVINEDVSKLSQELTTLFQEEMIVKGAQDFGICMEEVEKARQEAKKEGARELVGKVMSLLPSSPDFYSKFMELYAEIVSPKPLLNSEKK